MNNNNTTNLEDLRNQYVNRETEQIKKRQLKIYNDMMENNEILFRNSIPIEVFEHVFLNYFRNINNNQDNEDIKNNDHLLKKWLEIAGSYYNEVDLVNSHGDVVLVVPALTPKPNVNINGLSNHYITNIGEDIINESRYSNIAAENKMREAFITMPHVFMNDQHLKEAELKWKAIFMYFNKEDNQISEDQSVNQKYFSDEIGLEYD